MIHRLNSGSVTTAILIALISPATAANETLSRYLLQALPENLSPAVEVAPERDSWLSESELRYDLNENGDYSLALRFAPGTRDRGAAEYRLQQLMIARARQLGRQEQGVDLLQRYQLLLEMISQQARLDSLQAELKLDAERVTHQRAQIPTESFDIADLQKAELAHAGTRQQIELARIKLQNLVTALADASAAAAMLEDWQRQLVSWNTIVREIDHGSSLEIESAIEGNVDGIDLQLAREQLKIEREDRARWFEFVELKYRELDSGEQETSVALSIPLGNRPLPMVQRSLALNRADYRFRSNLQRQQSKLRAQQRELKWSYQQVQSMQHRQTALQRQLQKLQSVKQPELSIALNAELLQLEQQLHQFHIRGVETYLALLQVNGRLAQPPLRNWMLRDRPLL